MTIRIPQDCLCSNFISGLCERGFLVEVLRCAPMADHCGHSLMRIMGPNNLDEVELRDLMLKNEAPGYFEISRTGPGTYLVMTTNKSCRLCNIIAESGCFLESATAITSDLLVWNLLSPDADSIKDLIQKIKVEHCEVSEISTHDENIKSGLTFKQMRDIHIAFEFGYFDIPQGITLDILASRLGCAKSTLDISLRRAERKMLVQYLAKP